MTSFCVQGGKGSKSPIFMCTYLLNVPLGEWFFFVEYVVCSNFLDKEAVMVLSVSSQRRFMAFSFNLSQPVSCDNGATIQPAAASSSDYLLMLFFPFQCNNV